MGFTAHCRRDAHGYAHRELCTPKFLKKFISPGSSATTDSFLNGSLAEQGFGSNFMPPFANSRKERPLGGWENQRRIFLPVLRLESMLLTLRSSRDREGKYTNSPWNNLRRKKLTSRKIKPSMEACGPFPNPSEVTAATVQLGNPNPAMLTWPTLTPCLGDFLHFSHFSAWDGSGSQG